VVTTTTTTTTPGGMTQVVPQQLVEEHKEELTQCTECVAVGKLCQQLDEGGACIRCRAAGTLCSLAPQQVAPSCVLVAKQDLPEKVALCGHQLQGVFCFLCVSSQTSQ